ncbi:MAG: squalene/phytoene synthase family protein [Porphyrobacter sp.]|nr:squalene/phytoene synthase family protein [Porphyrobacter sp.]
MDSADLAELPLVSRLALGYCPPARRAGLGAVLALDHRLSQLVARTHEPMLGQMRLAWWREALQQPPASRPQGDVVLDAITRGWPDPCAPLVALVDGWEYLLAPEPLDETAARQFAEGRARALVAACGTHGPAAQPRRTPPAGRAGAG